MRSPLQWLNDDSFEFPDPATALTTPNGLLAVGGDLRPERLLRAYQRGIFPWFDADQPPLWWTPDPRMVLFPYDLHVSRSLQKFRRYTSLRISSDQAFAEVMQACAGPRRGANGTWISPGMQIAYEQLHRDGYAHSVEVWDGSTLVGGLYGIAMGTVFFGESMFSHVSNASKLAFVHLVQVLAANGWKLIDCQVANPHLLSLGARNIPRAEFMRYLPECLPNSLTDRLPNHADIPKPPRWPLQ